jgi:hypothetical protein
MPLRAPDGAGTAHTGRGYLGHLADIGGTTGFREPMRKAVAAFIAANFFDPDMLALKRDLRRAIAAADPGPRPAAAIAEYMGDAHLDDIITWTMQREREKRDAIAAAVKAVPPTFVDRAVPLAEAERLSVEAIARVADAIRAQTLPRTLLRLTVGAGKSAAAIAALPQFIDAAEEAGRPGVGFYAVPRHELGDELVARIRAVHPHLTAAIWRGMDRPDRAAPSYDPGRRMCRNPDLAKMAVAAGQPATAACKACPFYPHEGKPERERC